MLPRLMAPPLTLARCAEDALRRSIYRTGRPIAYFDKVLSRPIRPRRFARFAATGHSCAAVMILIRPICCRSTASGAAIDDEISAPRRPLQMMRCRYATLEYLLVLLMDAADGIADCWRACFSARRFATASHGQMLARHWRR